MDGSPDIPTRIVLDPSLVLRTRGVQWMHRARALSMEVSPIWTSGTLLDASTNLCEGILHELQSLPMGYFPARAVMMGSSASDLPIHRCYENYFTANNLSPKLKIAGETFSAVLETGILASRRLASIEWLVHQDLIEIRWRGRNFYNQVQDQVFELLPADLAASLLRRCRFLATAEINNGQPTLVVGDNAWSSSR